MISKKKILLLLVFSLSAGLIVLCPGSFSWAETKTASLRIYPQRATFTSESTFDVSLFLDTAGHAVNVIYLELRFDPEKLRVISPVKQVSLVEEWIFPPRFSNDKGTITLKGGFLGEGINTSEGLITTISFQALEPGQVTLEILDSSQVLSGGQEGYDLLGSCNKAFFEIVSSPPQGPEIFSETHPNQTRWYHNNTPAFNWSSDKGVVGYSYSFDDNPYGEPDRVIDTREETVVLEDCPEGKQYFHLRAQRGTVWGATSHFRVNIDKTPPQVFNPYMEPFSFKDYFLIYFETQDNLSGVEGYQVRLADFTEPDNAVLSAWQWADAPFRFDKGKKGTFVVMVRAFDKAGNYQEGRIEIESSSPFLSRLRGGFQIKGIFLPTWLCYIIPFLIVAYLIYRFFYWLLRKRESMRTRLKREVSEAEKEIEDVKRLERKIGETRALEEKLRSEGKRLANRLNNRRDDESPY